MVVAVNVIHLPVCLNLNLFSVVAHVGYNSPGHFRQGALDFILSCTTTNPNPTPCWFGCVRANK